MKIRFYIILLSLLSLLACNRENIHCFPSMEKADRIMEDNPDSARKLLAHIKDEIITENEATRMHYDMLRVKADDKCYIKHTSDSTMQKVVNYYEHHGTKEQLMEAYYLMGRVYDDMNFMAQALEFYHKTLNVDGIGSKSSIICHHANLEIGNIYMYQMSFKQALYSFLKAYKLANRANYTKGMIYALYYMGRCYHSQNKLLTGIFYYEKAALLAQRYKLDSMYKFVLGELAALYIENKEYGKAKMALLVSNHQDSSQNLSVYYNIKGNLFSDIQQRDSAIYYYKKSLTMGDTYVHQAAAQSLYQIFDERGDYRQASEYAFDLALYTDSINTLNLKKNQTLIQTLAKKLQVEQENSLLKEKEANEEVTILVLVIAFVCVGIVVLLLAKRRRTQVKEQRERLSRIMEQQQNSRKEMNESVLRIEELERQLSSSKQESSEWQERLLQSEKDWQMKLNSQMQADKERQALHVENLERSDIYIGFHRKGVRHEKATDDEFDELEKALNKAYNGFVNRLYELRPSMSPKEMRTCMLVKIGVSPKESTSILCTSLSNVGMIRSRLYKKIFEKNGSPEEFDNFIRKL